MGGEEARGARGLPSRSRGLGEGAGPPPAGAPRPELGTKHAPWGVGGRAEGVLEAAPRPDPTLRRRGRKGWGLGSDAAAVGSGFASAPDPPTPPTPASMGTPGPSPFTPLPGAGKWPHPRGPRNVTRRVPPPPLDRLPPAIFIDVYHSRPWPSPLPSRGPTHIPPQGLDPTSSFPTARRSGSPDSSLLGVGAFYGDFRGLPHTRLCDGVTLRRDQGVK